MKESPQTKKLEEMLRSGKLAAGGFMGKDTRHVWEIIEADRSQVERSGYDCQQIAERMTELTEQAKPRLSNWVKLSQGIEASCVDFKGSIICPWPHPAKSIKRITTLRRTKTQQTIRWTDLSIHLIAEHNFFEGKGSAFRIDPKELIDFIFET